MKNTNLCDCGAWEKSEALVSVGEPRAGFMMNRDVAERLKVKWYPIHEPTCCVAVACRLIEAAR